MTDWIFGYLAIGLGWTLLDRRGFTRTWFRPVVDVMREQAPKLEQPRLWLAFSTVVLLSVIVTAIGAAIWVGDAAERAVEHFAARAS